MTGNYTLLKQFGNAIKNKRLSECISAEALSESVKISRATLWAVENGNGNVAIKTYLDIAEVLGLKIGFDFDQSLKVQRQRSPKRMTKEKIKKNQFEVFCIEKYSSHIKNSSNKVYSLFRREKLLDLLRTDYEDLHGMGTEFLMQFFDSYLERTKI